MLRHSTPSWRLNTWPGLALCGCGTVAALSLGRLLPGLSPLLVAMVLGIAVGNTVRLPASCAPGIAFSSRRLLRLGVVLLGLRLTLSDVTSLGSGMLLTVAAVVAVGVATTTWLGLRLGLGRSQSLLIACGFSICGAAAIGALDGVVDADEEEVVTAVGLVVAFGTVMIPVLPLLGARLGLAPESTAMWAGASVHEVAQVVAIGASLGGPALAVAVVVKLARVVLLAPALAVISLLQRRAGASTGAHPPVVPLFVIGFLAAAALRSAGLVPAAVVPVAAEAQDVLLCAAMFALGTGARARILARIGPGPIVLATLATVLVSGIGLAGVLLVG
ncbi:YeiH family protein [Tessaracoccus lacteus]|uniref:Sulfate exporter family transporter n=1 Tax=Tessaracoccus lacteus TaxID=3041766 RepID=A0ABY8Q0E0_9ACTN|nr:putative sulfate exporter family transporter [Tessaracoccus sp. T21]WGT48209.1 putative sulfate exporter family transporter [Tessaracoccus sp. T21]